MVALFVPLKALCRLLEPRELPSREHAAELLGKSDDGWVRRARIFDGCSFRVSPDAHYVVEHRLIAGELGQEFERARPICTARDRRSGKLATRLVDIGRHKAAFGFAAIGGRAEPNNQLKENSKVVVEKVMLAHNWDELGQVSSADVVCVSVITIFETL